MSVKTKNKHASALGRLARGKPKNFSVSERRRRQQRMRALNARRRRRKAKYPESTVTDFWRVPGDVQAEFRKAKQA